METALLSSTGHSGNVLLKKMLLICGLLSSLLYGAMNIFIPMLYEDYDSASYTVSELSAIGAPIRGIWLAWITVYTILFIAFAWGIRMSAHQNRNLRIVAILMIVHAVIGIFWPPMHQRVVLAEGGGTLTDTLHIVWVMITVPLMLLEIGFGAAAFGLRFRWYSIVTISILILFGILTGIGSDELEANLPTPWIGVWERINIGGYMLWVVVLAIILLREQKPPEVKNNTDIYKRKIEFSLRQKDFNLP